VADYAPSLVYPYEVRNSFSPPLEFDDVGEQDLLNKIEMVEDYIKATYFNDSMPTRAKGKVPALLIVMSKIMRGNPVVAKKYNDVQEFTLGDYSVTYDSTARGKHVNAYESAKSWEEMAHEMLKKRASSEHNWTTPILVNG